MEGTQKDWLRLTAMITGNPSGTRCDACRETGSFHCSDAFDGCSGMRLYTVEELVEAIARKKPTDLDRIKRMEDANWKPASVYWRERAEKAEAKLADAEARLELAAGMLEVFQTQTAKFRRDMEAERERCAQIVAKGWGKSVDAIWLEIVGRGQ